MTLPDSLIFWLFIPGLFLVLAFGWLIYMSRGRRNTRFSLSGFGIAITFDSRGGDKQPVLVTEKRA